MQAHSHIIRRVIQERQEGAQIKRDAFLYLNPKSPEEKFAQCETCAMWTGPEHNTCTILGPDLEVTAGSTCALYVPGEPVPEEAGNEQERLTQEEAGFVKDTQVRCENCRSLTGRICQLFTALNKALPDHFDLDDQVDPFGCCNAWRAKK